ESITRKYPNRFPWLRRRVFDMREVIKKPGFLASRRQWLRRASAATVASAFPGLNARGQDEPDPHQLEHEKACRRNLKLIFDGVSRFLSDGREHPYRLSDLAGTYIDRDVLLCPSLVSRGRLQNPRSDLVSNIAHDPLTFYVWEYSLNKLEGTGKTNRDFKSRQRQTPVGDWVPMVRCHAHSRPDRRLHLNLTFGGAIYESGLYWETLFRHICPLPYLGHSDLFFSEAHPPNYTADIPKRASRAAQGAVNLSDAYNALLTDAWNSDETPDQLGDWVVRLGSDWLFDHAGIQFDVRGVVQLEGDAVRLNRDRNPDMQVASYPRSVGPIAVGQPASRLHVLAGVIHGETDGSEVGRINLLCRHGKVESLPLIQGRHVCHQPTGKEAPQAESTLVHRRQSVVGTSDYAPHAIYHVTWTLPEAGTVIDRLEFSATQGATSPFFMAITIEP
ncbi:MAG: hypothetical protein ACKV19_25135, partial [Verrucomicrobiales bacterium]